LEAAEQSWSWFYPEIKILESLKNIPEKTAILDFDGQYYKNTNLENINFILI
jgi:16S rRNA U1498 N3-methylase RsmE